MLSVLKTEMEDRQIEAADVADSLGVTERNFNCKLAETLPFTRDEMFAVRDRFFPEVSLEKLFASDGNVPSESERAKHRVQALADKIVTDGTPMDAEKAEIINDLYESSERCDPALVNHVLSV